MLSRSTSLIHTVTVCSDEFDDDDDDDVRCNCVKLVKHYRKKMSYNDELFAFLAAIQCAAIKRPHYKKLQNSETSLDKIVNNY